MIGGRQAQEDPNIVTGCVLDLMGQTLDIDLKPIALGSFDVVIGMDWLSKHQAEIICQEKIVRIPLPHGETYVQGEKSSMPLRLISCMKAHKCVRKGHTSVIALITKKPVVEKKIEDIPMICEFPEVFPEDLPDRWNFELTLHQTRHL
ncbi:hypothetical protein R6Q59_019886 [Mikania micrantha]